MAGAASEWAAIRTDGVSLLCKAAAMASDSSLVAHYENDGALDRIRHELTAAGHDIESLTPEALSAVDEFHLGGRLATTALLDSMNVGAGSAVLDVGSGIGGVARTIAASTGAHVTGVDLTPSFVTIAGELSALVGLFEATRFTVANALALPFDDATFDAVTMVHVGMNIDDKVQLFAELARVTRPGGRVHVYDIMRVGDGDITYPVPWSSTPETSFVASPADYADAMTAAGLTPAEPVDHLDLVRRAVAGAQANPPAVNLSHLMGSEWPTMIANLLACLNAGVLSPTEITATA